MNELTQCYGDQGLGYAFIYTHEAHPGENYPHLTSMEEKFHHARSARSARG